MKGTKNQPLKLSHLVFKKIVGYFVLLSVI